MRLTKQNAKSVIVVRHLHGLVWVLTWIHMARIKPHFISPSDRSAWVLYQQNVSPHLIWHSTLTSSFFPITGVWFKLNLLDMFQCMGQLTLEWNNHSTYALFPTSRIARAPQDENNAYRCRKDSIKLPRADWRLCKRCWKQSFSRQPEFLNLPWFNWWCQTALVNHHASEHMLLQRVVGQY